MSRQMGLLYVDKQPTSRDVALILNSLADVEHAPPAYWSGEGVFLAYAGIQGSIAGASEEQPYVTAHASITFDGRLDNREELRSLLRLDPGEAPGNAALALAVYMRFGPQGLDRLVGDWSLAIADEDKDRLLLASDFAGVRPLYYYADGQWIVWSTQLGALVEWILPTKIDDGYVAGFLAHGGTPDLTPFLGVKSVRPGHYLVYSRGQLQQHRFWQPPVDNIIRFHRESDYEDRVIELFRDAVSVRLSTDAPVISELSGGLDSSSIVCMAKHLFDTGSARPPLFVTLSYEREGSLDTRFYSAIENWSGFRAIHLSTAQHVFISETDTGDALPTFWTQLHAAVAAEARKLGARTLLSGQLGDLIMGNWSDDSGQIAGLLRDREVRRALQQSLEWSLALRLPIGGVLWRALLLLLPASMIRSRSDLFSDGFDPAASKEDSITPGFRARVDVANGQNLGSAWMGARPERLKHFRGLLEMLELRQLQPSEALAHLSYTHPFAHRPLVEFMLSIPPDVVCRPRERRRLMRCAFRRFWAPSVNGRRSKDSFGATFLAALRPLARALIRDVKQLQLVQRGYVDPTNLQDRLERLTYSLDNNEGQLRRLILLELWLRRAAARWSL